MRLKARRAPESVNVETHGVRLKALWRMQNVLKGRNFHNRRSTTCGSLSITSSA
ncbi:MAG: hypothetical protein LBF89_01845 [Bacteroidales bacterium]|nr:hypothetical protein [Bacteroidales bacterium]